MDHFMLEAFERAKMGFEEGGIPIGSVLVREGAIIASGRNRRVQQGNPILHAEMDCLQNAGRLKASDYRQATLYSTLSPCDMCSGAILLYHIPRVVIGENVSFRGPEDYLRTRGIDLVILNDTSLIGLMRRFINAFPDLWNEDIGI